MMHRTNDYSCVVCMCEIGVSDTSNAGEIDVSDAEKRVSNADQSAEAVAM